MPTGLLTAFDLIALGQLYEGQQRFAEARPLLQRSVDIFESADGGDEYAIAARMTLVLLEHATGNTEDADRPCAPFP